MTEEKDGCYSYINCSQVAARCADRWTVLLDVRTPREFAVARIPGATLIPVGELAARIGELDPARPIICICEHGVRAEAAAEFLANNGFEQVATMRGGMTRWTGAVERG